MIAESVMADFLNVLGHVELTGLVQRLQFPNLVFAPKLPVRVLNGDIARWTVEKPDIEIYNYFVGRSGGAQPLRTGDFYEKTFSIPYRFTSKTFDGGVLSQLNRPGTLDYDNAKSLVAAEVAKMEQKVGAYTDEYLTVQALLGSLTIKLGNAAGSSNQAISFEIPAGNSFTANAPWSTVGTNITKDFETAKDILAEFGVVPAYYALDNQMATRIMRNTDVQNVVKEYRAGREILEMGGLPPIHGLKPLVVSHRYADIGQVDGFKKNFMAADTVLFLPEFPTAVGDWIEMQAADFYVPDSGQADLVQSTGGSATWSRTTDSPTGVTVYHKICRFPVVRQPWNICKMTTS